MPDFMKVIIYTMSSFAVLFILAKLLGKKQIAQLDFVDYVLGITIGSIAGNMATDLESPFYHYIIAMTAFFLLDLFINFLSKKGPFLKQLMQGRPVTIIYEGNIIYENLKKSKLDINDFLAMCRAKNYFDVKNIYYAVFETSGEISIIPTATQRPIVSSDINAPQLPPELPCYLVCDGKISKSGLNEINKSEDWLFDKLGLKNKKELKNILLALYDSNNDTVKSHTKN